MAYDIGVKLGVEGEKAFKASLGAVDAQLKSLGAEMKAVTADFAKNEGSIEALSAKNQVLGRSLEAAQQEMGLLTKEIASQREKLDGLGGKYQETQEAMAKAAAAAEEAQRKFGDEAQETLEAQKALTAASAEAVKAQNAYNSQVKKVAELEGKLNTARASVAEMTAAVDENKRALAYGGTEMAEFSGEAKEAAGALDKAGKAGLSFGDVLKAHIISDAVIGGVKLLGSALKSAGSALVDLGKQSLAGYGDYEQLVGGVKTLFGTEAESLQEYAASVGQSVDEAAEEFGRLQRAQNTVLSNARGAYRTAGLSANEYMETVTGFAASLLQSLGGDTEAAADKADQALTDMADNANKMGTAMESIQNAYQGFAKQNYTMLDNLKLGYGGTKEEMERLLADAQKLSGMEYDISSYADIVDAIHVVQTEMGITGTTAREASETIQGSVNATKAAWSNLVAGLADEDADMEALLGDLVESAGTAADNIGPRIRTALENLGGLLPELARKIGREAPGAIAEAVPALVEAGGSLVSGLAEGVMDAAPELWEKTKQAAGEALSQFDMEEALSTGGELLGKVARGVWNTIPKINDAIGDTVKALWDGFWKTDWLELGRELINGIIKGFTGKAETISEEALAIGKNIVNWLIQGVTGGIPAIGKALVNLATDGMAALKEKLGIHSPSTLFRDEIGENIGLGVAEGISDSSSKAVKAADKLAKDVYKRSADWADKQTKYMAWSYDEQIEAWEAIQRQFISTSKQYSDAEEKIFDLRQKKTEAALKEQEKAQDQFAKKVEAANQAITKSIENYQKELEGRTSQIFNAYKLFDEVPNQERVSGDALIRNLKEQNQAIQEFYDSIAALKERGIGGELLEELRDMGPGATAEIKALLNLSDKRLEEYAELYKDKQDLANQYALEGLEELRAETEQSIVDNLAAVRDLYNKEAPDIGIAMTDGLREGIREGKIAVLAEAMEMAQETVDAMNRVLGIHSPSKVFRDMGEYMMRGLDNGLVQGEKAVLRTAGGLASQIVSSYQDLLPGVGNSSGADQMTERFGAMLSQAVNAMGMLSGGGNGRYVIELNLNIDGKRFYSETLEDLRFVERSTPEVV